METVKEFATTTPQCLWDALEGFVDDIDKTSLVNIKQLIFVKKELK